MVWPGVAVAFNRLKGQDVKKIIVGIRTEVDQYVQDTPASDDVTMLALTLMKPDNSEVYE